MRAEKGMVYERLRWMLAASVVACGGDGASQDGGSTSADGDDDDGATTDTRGTTSEPPATEDGPATNASSEGTTTTGEIDDPGIFDVNVIPDGPPTTVSECECAEGTDVIYVLSDNAELWSFDPEELEFTLISSFSCDGLISTFSMGVDRNAIAWVMFQGAEIYNIDVNNPLACIDPGYTPGQGGFDLYGMAFVSEGEDNPCDQLYALRYSGGIGFQEGPGIGALGTMKTDDLLLDVLGPTDYDGGELTGTGDGRLFAFAGASPAKLVEFDKDDASVIDILPLDTLELTNAFAFSFFAGDFYFFTEGAGFVSSQVTHMDYDDSDADGEQQLEVVVPNAPIRIVGAGVSTCAPTIPPQG
jgi:hypothetical protein